MKTQTIPLKEETTDYIAMVKATCVGLLSFLFGGAALFGSITPFSVAFVACMPFKFIIPATIGSVIGIMLKSSFNSTSFGWWLILSVLLVAALKFLLGKIAIKHGKKIKPAFLGILSFACMLFSTILYTLTSEIAGIDIVLIVIQTVLCGCFGYFFSIASDAIFRPRLSPILSQIQITSLVILLICALCGATGYTVFGVNLGVIFSVLTVYIAMNKYGVVGASVASIVASIALNLCTVDMLSFAAMLIMASFIAGAFSILGKLGQISAFILVSTFCMMLLGAPMWLTYRLIDIFLATAIYVLIPKRIMALIDLRPQDEANSINAGTMQSNVETKLSYASDTVKDLEKELKRVSAKFCEIDYNNIGSIYDVAANSVCKGCSRALDCWDKSYSDTVDAFNPITAKLKGTGSVSEDNMPTYFIEKCCKLTKLIETINEYYQSFLAGQTAKRQISESRKIVFEQFSALSDMLCEIGSEVGAITGYDEKTAQKAFFTFKKLEQEPLQVICTVDKFGRKTIEIYTDNILRTSKIILCQALSNSTNCLFDLPDIETAGNKTKISFFEKAAFSIDYSIQQICCGNNTVCGDQTEHFTDSKGISYFLLSDGMGNGGRAAIDSVMTCSVIAKLLKAGFGVSAALKLINSSLLVKSTDESLSTIDLAKIDLYTGKAELYKAGAATSFFYQNGEISRFSSSALPIGILQKAECEEKIMTLRIGDCLLMLSDGANADGTSNGTSTVGTCTDGNTNGNFIADELKRLCTQNIPAKEIAVNICKAINEHQGQPQDDITVIAIKIEKGI